MGIRGTTSLTRRQVGGFLADAAQAVHRLLPIIIKVFVVSFPLADAHILHVGNEKFYLVVAVLLNLVEPPAGLLEIELRHLRKGEIVASLGIAGIIVVGKSQSPASQLGGGV